MKREMEIAQVESLLAELHQAEQAGVFRSTPAESALDELKNPVPSGVVWGKRVRAAVAMAAVVVAALWIGPVLRNGSREALISGSSRDSAAAARLVAFRGFDRCLDDPSARSALLCTQFDIDQDRRVSLADYAGLQRRAFESTH